MAAYAIRQMAYDECNKKFGSLTDLRISSSVFIKWVFHLTCHERIGIFFEDPQAGVGTEIDGPAVIVRTGIFHRVFNGSPTGSTIFR